MHAGTGAKDEQIRTYEGFTYDMGLSLTDISSLYYTTNKPENTYKTTVISIPLLQWSLRDVNSRINVFLFTYIAQL